MEDAVSRDPEFVLILGNSKNMGYSEGLVKSWDRFPKLAAVKGGHVLAPGGRSDRPPGAAGS